MADRSPDTASTAALMHEHGALRVTGTRSDATREQVIAEVPVALLYNGESFAVMMATPCDLEDFALGFALTEGVVADASELQLVDVVESEHGIALHAAIPQQRFDALAGRTRSLPGRSGCGLCGVESLQAAIAPVPRVPTQPPIERRAIVAALQSLRALQPLNARSGGAHAAAWVHAGGLLVREDVGRHNALDKVAGAAARGGFGDGFVLVTSRASYELVHKTAMMGAGVLAAISAPTSLAIRSAEQAGIALVAFARGDAMTIYTHSERLLLDEAAAGAAPT